MPNLTKVRAGDKVELVSGELFSNGKQVVTVREVTGVRVRLLETNSSIYANELKVHTPAPIKEPATDNVNSPAHYTTGGIETLDFMRAKLTAEGYVGYLQGNIIKYTVRFEHKNGVEDLKKAEFYLRELIKVKEGN